LAAGQDGVRCRSSVGQDGARWWRSVLVRDWRGERRGQGNGDSISCGELTTVGLQAMGGAMGRFFMANPTKLTCESQIKLLYRVGLRYFRMGGQCLVSLI
jgi:hypothetical protein